MQHRPSPICSTILTHKSPLGDSTMSPGSKMGRSLGSSIICQCHFFCIIISVCIFIFATRVVTWLVPRFSAGKFKSHQPNSSLVYSTDVFLKYISVGHCSYVSTMKYCKECLKQRMKLATARASVRFESRPALTICRTVSELSKERKPIQNSFKS